MGLTLGDAATGKSRDGDRAPAARGCGERARKRANGGRGRRGKRASSLPSCRCCSWRGREWPDGGVALLGVQRPEAEGNRSAPASPGLPPRFPAQGGRGRRGAAQDGLRSAPGCLYRRRYGGDAAFPWRSLERETQRERKQVSEGRRIGGRESGQVGAGSTTSGRGTRRHGSSEWCGGDGVGRSISFACSVATGERKMIVCEKTPGSKYFSCKQVQQQFIDLNLGHLNLFINSTKIHKGST